VLVLKEFKSNLERFSMALTQEQLLSALKEVSDPYTGRDYVSSKSIKNLSINPQAISFELELGYPAKSQWSAIEDKLTKVIHRLPEAQDVQLKITFSTQIVAHTAQGGVQLLPQVKNIIGVASGKGGVGKSTTAANLALALQAEGASVGLLDADIYGPSQPMMMGLSGRPESSDGKTMNPLISHGVQVMSIGFLVSPDEAMVWRGPMATQALEQLLRQTNWKSLDYLIIDLPPGTGDIQLTLSQRVPMTGSVIVTTPQDIALIDARKGIRMFEKVGVPIMGVLENMAVHICSKCGHAEHIFGEGGGQTMASDLGVDYLGSLPLDINIRLQADKGLPTVVADPTSQVAEIYKDIARRVAAKVSSKTKDFSSKFPTIKISKTT
jgi:ATP-binding protein involved in chromosome partitioning